jgi:hypothetical protein
MTAEPKLYEPRIPILVEEGGEKRMETSTKAWSHVVGPLTEHPAVLAIVLFGSTATGKRRPFSDVDLCIIGSRPLDREEKEDLFSNSAPGYDLSFFQDLPLYIQYRVFRDGKVLFCRDETQLQRLKGRTISGYLDFSRILRRCCDRVLGECDVRP